MPSSGMILAGSSVALLADTAIVSVMAAAEHMLLTSIMLEVESFANVDMPELNAAVEAAVDDRKYMRVAIWLICLLEKMFGWIECVGLDMSNDAMRDF